MEINTIEDIVSLLMRRDGIDENEAWHLVKECREELENLMMDNGDGYGYAPYEEATDIVADWLGLEPDYLPIIMDY